MGMKKCLRCKKKRKVSEFNKKAISRDGLDCYCRSCVSEANRKCNEKYQDRRRAESREHYRKQKVKDPTFLQKHYQRYKEVNRQRDSSAHWKTVEGRSRRLLHGVKARSRIYGYEFDLTKEWILDKFLEQGNRCLLTGIDFDFNFSKGFKSNVSPFSPSLDRIDSNKGYTRDNVRLVCTCINTGMNCFGLENFKKICVAFIKHNKIVVK